jgi:hypothetical protein
MHGHINVKKIYQYCQVTVSCYSYLKQISYFKFKIVLITNTSSSFFLYLFFYLFLFIYLFILSQIPQWARAPSFTRFLDHTQRRTTVSRTPLYEWSVRRRDLYLTTHNAHNRQTSMLACGFRTHDAAGEWPHGHWDRPHYKLSLLILMILWNPYHILWARLRALNVQAGG